MADHAVPDAANSPWHHVDPFPLALPLPYRAALIVVTGIWAWGLNLRAFSDLRIDVSSLIKYTSKNNQGLPQYHRIFRLASTAAILLAISLSIFWIVTKQDPAAVRNWQILPLSYLLLLVVLFVLPLQRLSKNGRYRFLSTLRRVSIGGLAESSDGKFGDILLADALTSYARVLGDLALSLCMLIAGESSTGKPNKRCGGGVLYPVVLAIPFAIRLRQCLIEFFRVRKNPASSAGWGGQHLANALKYATAFPVIIFSNMSKAPTFDINTPIGRYWLVAILVNASYSFYWDVTKDWDLTALSKERNDPGQPYGLRSRLYFAPWKYYTAIGLDFTLRFVWAFKLIPTVEANYMPMEIVVYSLQFMEVFRRWIWIFFRVETEWVRAHVGPLPDDILLGEYERTDFDKYDID